MFPFEFDCDKKKVRVTFLPSKLTVEYDGKGFHELAFYGKVDCDGCTWTLDGARKLVVTVEKAEAGVSWPRVSEGA